MTDASLQWLLNAIFGLAMLSGGWILGRITKSLDQLDSDVRHFPEKYVLKEDYASTLQNIYAAIIRIEEKINGKADR